jgi:EgtB-related family protein
MDRVAVRALSGLRSQARNADYSQPWFGDHHVMRGGSWATRSRLVHPRLRNFYLPDRHDMFVGFRTCAIG